jgi:hypothetical protein
MFKCLSQSEPEKQKIAVLAKASDKLNGEHMVGKLEMRTLAVVSAHIVLIVGSLGAFAQSYVPGEVIVKYRTTHGASSASSFARRAVGRHMQIKTHFEKLNMYHLGLSSGQSVESAISDLKQDPDVAYVEPNFILKKQSDSGVQQTFSAEELHAAAQSNQVLSTGADIGLAQVYQRTQSQGGYVGALSARPIIAVIDTGLDTTHPVFVNSNAVWTNPGEIPANGIDDDGNGFIDDVNGYNFVSNSGTMLDDDGHGTHVSGIILSVDQNIFAAQLQTSKIAIMPLKFLDGTGSGSTSNAIRAIYYAIQNGAVVLNNSWGGSDYSSALNEAIAYSYNAGAVFVAAAGNGNNGVGYSDDVTPEYPANYDVPNVISTAAIDDSNDLASFSNFGQNTVALGSPGVYILSTLPGDRYGSMSGTSMATPFVAGTAIQMKVNSPNMLGYQVKNLIMGQTTQVSSLVQRVATNGMLNTASAISTSASASVDTSQPAYVMSYQPDRSLASSLAGGGCGMVTKMDGEAGPPNGIGGMLITFGLVMAPLAYLIFRRMKNPVNRRKHERFRISSEVRINVGDKELVGSVSSISLGGVQVDTNALMQDGGLVTLTIASPDGSQRLEVEGRVVWAEENKSYGVAFDQAPQSVLSQISDWTKGLQKA